MKTHVLVATTIGTMLALAACTPPDATDTPSPVPTATVTVTITQTPSAPPSAPAAPTPGFDFTSHEGAQIGSTLFSTHMSGHSASGPVSRDADGVGVGNTRADVFAAYPGAVVGSFADLTVGPLTTITICDTAGTSRDVFAIPGNSADPNLTNLLPWGGGATGAQWGHLCTGL